MGRKSGPDEMKLRAIRQVLKRHTEGLWVREIARKAGLDRSTVSRYLHEHMLVEVDSNYYGRNKFVWLA